MPSEHEAGNGRNVEASDHYLAEGGLAFRKGVVGLVPEDRDDIAAETLHVRDRRVVRCGGPLSPHSDDEGRNQGDSQDRAPRQTIDSSKV